MEHQQNAVTATDLDLEAILEVAQKAALIAGAEIRKRWFTHNANREFNNITDSEIGLKSSHTDLVTETDKKCENLIIQYLQKHFSDHEIIGEESHVEKSTLSADPLSHNKTYELTDRPTWTIDPIDGTTNFVHRLKLSCVLISFLSNKSVLVGVTYDPLADELFYATKGKGAFLKTGNQLSTPNNDVSFESVYPIKVSETRTIPKAVISLDPGYERDQFSVNEFLSIQKSILLKGARNIRILGSTGLNMAFVACGRLDAAFEEGSWDRDKERGPKIWDFAAGKLLVEEAGGVTRDIEKNQENKYVDGSSKNELDLMGRSFFCASKTQLADEIINCVKKNKV